MDPRRAWMAVLVGLACNRPEPAAPPDGASLAEAPAHGRDPPPAEERAPMDEPFAAAERIFAAIAQLQRDHKRLEGLSVDEHVHRDADSMRLQFSHGESRIVKPDCPPGAKCSVREEWEPGSVAVVIDVYRGALPLMTRVVVPLEIGNLKVVVDVFGPDEPEVAAIRTAIARIVAGESTQ